MAILDGVDAWPEIPPEYAVGQHGYPPLPASGGKSDHGPSSEGEHAHHGGHQFAFGTGRARMGSFQYVEYCASLVKKIMGFLEGLLA